MPENYQAICARLERETLLGKDPRILGGGTYGSIYRIQGTAAEGSFVLKRFRDDKHCSAPELAEHALQVHRRFKNMGVTVHEYYDHVYPGWVRMPDQASNGWRCASSNGIDSVNGGFDIDKFRKVTQVVDFEAYLDGVFNEALIIGRNRINLPPDTLFLRLHCEGREVEIQSLWGDYDAIMLGPKFSSTSKLMIDATLTAHNSVRDTLSSVLPNNLMATLMVSLGEHKRRVMSQL